MAKKKTDTGQLDLFGESNTIQLLNGQIAMIEKKILALFGSTYKYAAQLAQVRDAVNSGNASFTFQSNPAAAKEIENRLTAVAQTLDQQLAKSTEQSYALGQASTNNALVQAFGKDKQTKKELKEISDDAVAAMRKRGADGHTFYTQPQGGVTISDRVWKLTESTKLELEIAIQNAVLEGQSADELARTIQQYLTHPNRLFRSIRVKDPTTGKWTGEYTMSEAAKRCHPGQGVYRSSYKNALRLARTELTQAYRRAEWETYQDNPLITGYRIELSNNHTTEVMTKKGRKTIPIKDICDKMAGTEYPKTFLWTGWHPQCRCRMVPILVTKNDFKERVKARHTGKLKEWQPKEQTTEMPKVFVEWVNDNKSRWQANGKAAPFFIRDNYQQGDVDKGLDTRITAAIEEAKLAAATAKAKAEKTRPQITEFDKTINLLRNVQWRFDLDLTQLEQLRAESKDRDALEKEVKKQEKEWHARSRMIDKADKELHKAMMEMRAKRDELAKLEPTAPELAKFDTEIKQINDARNDIDAVRGRTMQYTEQIDEYKALADKLNQLVKEADAAIAKVKPAQSTEVKKWIEETNSTAKFNSKELEEVSRAVEQKIQSWKGMPLSVLIKKIDFEISYVEKNKKYPTWEIAKQAYENYKKKIEDFDEFLNDKSDKREIVMRAQTHKEWNNLTPKEKKIVTKYTQTYSYLNEPLRGLTYSGSRPKSEFKPDLKTMTDALNKVTTTNDMTVRRGTSDFPIPELGGKQLSDIEIGEEFTDGAFLSTSVQKDHGFFDTINMIIYVHKGMAGIYAEPFSHYTDSQKYTWENASGKPDLWKGKIDESTGIEWEWIGQRGSRLRCIAKQGNTIFFEMIGQLQ